MTRVYHSAAKLIRGLARAELEQLQVVIAARLRALDEAERQAQARTSEPTDRGYIEEKWITSYGKQYGPYRYRRWWEDGHLKSAYLGKAADGKKVAKKK